MSVYPPPPADSADGVQAILDVAARAAKPSELTPGKVYGWVTPRGDVQKIDLTGNDYRDAPKAKAGTTQVWDVPAFLAYHEKHSDPQTEVYADAQALTVTAVLDAHSADGPRWGAHRLHLALRKTKVWEQWLAMDGKPMAQEPFAEFLEDHLDVLVRPAAAEFLEIAQSLQANSKVDFKSGVRLASGQRRLEFVETTVAKAGQKGTLDIPETFEIGLVPFEGSERFRVTGRFRYRINGSDLTLSYRLDRPEDTLKTAFGDVVDAIAAQVGTPVMNGSPARSA